VGHQDVDLFLSVGDYQANSYRIFLVYLDPDGLYDGDVVHRSSLVGLAGQTITEAMGPDRSRHSRLPTGIPRRRIRPLW